MGLKNWLGIGIVSRSRDVSPDGASQFYEYPTRLNHRDEIGLRRRHRSGEKQLPARHLVGPVARQAGTVEHRHIRDVGGFCTRLTRNRTMPRAH